MSRKLRNSDLTKFDYILAVDNEALRVLRYMFSGDVERQNIMLLGDFDAGNAGPIIDIYHGTEETFQSAYETMVKCAKGFISEVLKENC